MMRTTSTTEAARQEEQSDFIFNSLASQRERLLTHLRAHGSISTIEARERPDCLHPAGRIAELRDAGHDILLKWDYESTYAAEPMESGAII